MQPPATSYTLLKALGNDPACARWTEFAEKYTPCMENYLRARFPYLESFHADILQETFLALVKKLPDYHYAPDEKGYFSNYLIGIVHFKALAVVKRLNREGRRNEGFKAEMDAAEVTDNNDFDEVDWQHKAFEVALSQLMNDPTLKTTTKEIFRHAVLLGEPTDRVAALYGVTANNIAQIKNRLTARLKELATALISND